MLMMNTAAFVELGLICPMCPKLTVIVVEKVCSVPVFFDLAFLSRATASSRPFLPDVAEQS